MEKLAREDWNEYFCAQCLNNFYDYADKR
jgi:hypothetical protein